MLKKDNDTKSTAITDIITLFQTKEEDCYEPIRISNVFISNYIEYESHGDKDKTLSNENVFIRLDHI